MRKYTERIAAHVVGQWSKLTLFSFARFSIKEQIFFAKRMSFLITADVPILECLELIRTQTTSRSHRFVYDAIIRDVSSGQFLGVSLGRHPKFFGEFIVNLIRIGEEAGMLSQNLLYLADELHKKYLLRRKVVSALVYPLFISVATLGLTALLTAYIFPKLTPIFASLNVDLPLTTRALIAVSSYLRHWGIVTVIGIIGIMFIFLSIRSRYARVHLASDRLLLHVPILGSVVRAYNLANMCRTLGLLLRSGVGLTDAVASTARTTGNQVYGDACQMLAESTLTGEPLSRGLARRPELFPDLLPHMVAVGERTGNLANTLVYLAEFYEDEVDDHTKNLSSSIEPILMTVMGVMVGLIAVSVITPIYEMTSHLQAR